MLYTYNTNKRRKSEISETLQDLTLTVDTAAKSSLINSPFPLIILETNGNVIWKSNKFISEFANIDINNYITDLLIDKKREIERREDKKDKDIIKELEIGKKTYKILGRFVDSKKIDKKKEQEYMTILYFLDETENKKLQKRI